MTEGNEQPVQPAAIHDSEQVLSPEIDKPKHIALAFGQGPIKPVLLPDELTTQQREEWQLFKNRQYKDPQTGEIKSTANHYELKEPEFRVIESESYLKQLQDASEQERQRLRVHWQHESRFALHRYGRMVALATGAALASGKVDTVILCGGRTIPGWAKAEGTPLSLDQLQSWPSEASLMKQLIIQRFGKKYESRIKLEESSPTTIHNVALAVKEHGNLFDSAEDIVTITTDAHVTRAATITSLMTDGDTHVSHYPSETELEKRALAHGKEVYENMLDFFHNPTTNYVAALREQKEELLTDELTDLRVQTIWEMTGRVLPDLHDTIVRIVKKDSPWKEAAKPIFTEYGLDIEDKITGLRLVHLRSEKPQTYEELSKKIRQLNEQFPTQYGTGTDREIAAKKNV
jgi:hypothetical protein